MYDAKIKFALSNPPTYFNSKIKSLETLRNQVNTEFVKVFNDVNKYANKKKAKEMAYKSAKNLHEIGKHRIDIEYPEKLDKDIEGKLLFELKNKIK